MKITQVNIPADETVGLDTIKMSRLGQIILIAGKNGSGKTRLLSKIQNTFTQKPTEQYLQQIKQQQPNNRKALEHHKNQISPLEQSLSNNNLENHHLEFADQITTHEREIKTLEERIQANDQHLLWNKIETSEISDAYSCISFVPKTKELRDCNAFTKDQMIQAANAMDNIGIGYAPEGTLAKIQHAQEQWFNATHQNTTIGPDEQDKIKASYKKLCHYIKTFLNTDIDRDTDGNATIFGFKIGSAQLSDGQKILLQFCLAIYSQETQLSELIIHLDEPENHLHPQALIEVVDKLSHALPNGQIWIATHSVSLLAHYEASSIWYMEDGKVSYAGNIPKKVLTGLIGNDDEVSKLQNFLALPAQMANAQFAFECLLAPQTLETGSDDPQTNQIINAIKLKLVNKEKIKILDFGAGKGRLLSTISEFPSEIPISQWLDYYAYDLDTPDKDSCEKVIETVYENDTVRYFNSEKQLQESAHQGSFDMIVMCNVFHEIDPRDWIELFNRHSVIVDSLKEVGTLLIVEDQLIPVGEKAYKNGFLVFDKIQFKKLFKITDDYPVSDARDDGRLRAHFIPANQLTNVTHETKVEAIESLQHNAMKQVKSLREDEASYKNGKLHGFWVQQVANSQLALSELVK